MTAPDAGELGDQELRLVRALEGDLTVALPDEQASRALGALQELEGRLSFRARYDALTQLANRGTFQVAVDDALTRSSSQSAAVVLLDIDDFKLVNDTMGHAAGDHVLEEMAARISRGLRDRDLAARVGGDEFALLIEDGARALGVAEAMLDAVQEPFDILGEAVRLEASVGLALAGDGDDAAEMLRQADVAMNAAKRDGKARLVAFTDELHHEVVARTRLRADIRDGIAAGDFRVVYQPIVDLETGAAVGVEALLRWHSPSRGLVSPAEFVPEAEQSGLIVPLERWVLGQVLRDIGALRRRPGLEGLFVSVNISARHLMDADVADAVLETVASSALEPSDIVLELTETLMLERSERVIGQLARLREAGMRLAFDDFGTGYSSLAYLRRFPVDLLKIAQPFVDDLRVIDGEAGGAFAAAITMLGESLGLAVVAEGIEEVGQAAQLVDMGCSLGQGFLYAEPMPISELGDALRTVDLRQLRAGL